MMKVKICGITNLDDANLAVDLGADLVGFIFYSKSKRYLPFKKAGEIISRLPAGIEKVGVFVDEKIETVADAVNVSGITAVQLHGNEDQNYIDKLNVPVIKGFRIADNFDFSILRSLNNCSLLLDAYSANDFGGTGKSFDWKIIPQDLRSKIFLAGGVSSDNIEYIYNNIKPYAVDLSSSVEISPGIKDHNKLKTFFNTVNRLRRK